MSQPYPKPKMLCLDHVIISGYLFGAVYVILCVILDPNHMSVLVGLPLTFTLLGTGVYFALSLYGYLKMLEVGHDDRAKLEAEIAELKTKIKNADEIHTRTCEDANHEHGARRKLEANIFRAIQLLHLATRFKSTEALVVKELLERAMLETLETNSALRNDISNLKTEGAQS